MSKTKSTGKKTNRKKNSKQSSHKGCIVFLIVLALLALGLYLYSIHYQQSHPAKIVRAAQATQRDGPNRSSSGSTTYSKLTTYEALDIAISIIPRQEQIIRHTGYTVSYNKNLRLPNWVGYELTRQETQGNEERGDRFIADPLATGSIATNSDYLRSGYDKGHMAPAADMKWDTTVMKESFYFTNICPQHPELNRRKWKDLEEKTRNWAIADSAIIIVCGPIMEEHPKTLGKNRVAIPQKFFKVILSSYVSTPKAIGFLFDNERSVEPLCTYVVTVDSIERLTGLDFFAPLPDDIEDKVEAVATCSQWGL